MSNEKWTPPEVEKKETWTPPEVGGEITPEVTPKQQPLVQEQPAVTQGQQFAQPSTSNLAGSTFPSTDGLSASGNALSKVVSQPQKTTQQEVSLAQKPVNIAEAVKGNFFAPEVKKPENIDQLVEQQKFAGLKDYQVEKIKQAEKIVEDEFPDMKTSWMEQGQTQDPLSTSTPELYAESGTVVDPKANFEAMKAGKKIEVQTQISKMHDVAKDYNFLEVTARRNDKTVAQYVESRKDKIAENILNDPDLGVEKNLSLAAREYRLTNKINQLSKTTETGLGKKINDSQIKILEKEIENIKEERYTELDKEIYDLYEQHSDAGTASERAAIQKKIEELNGIRWNKVIEEPTTQAAKIADGMSDDAIILLDMMPKEMSNKEKFDAYYHTLYMKNQVLREQINKEEGGLPSATKEKTRGVSKNVETYYKNETTLRSLAPVFFINKAGAEQKEGWWDNFWNSLNNQVRPYSGNLIRIDENENARNIVSVLDETGLLEKGGVNQDFYKGMVSQTVNTPMLGETYRFWNPTTWGDINWNETGGTAGMLTGYGLEFALGNKVATTLGKLASTAVGVDKMKKLSDSYATFLANSPRVVKWAGNSIDEGLKFETTGQIFQSDKDEFNFLSGFTGGVLGDRVKNIALKGINSQYAGSAINYMYRTFGEKAPEAMAFLMKAGDKTLSATARGIGEVGQEFGEELAQIWQSSENGKGFMQELKDRFGDMSSAQEFVLTSFLMGSVFGINSSDKYFQEKYKLLSEADKRQIQPAMEDVAAGVVEAQVSVLKEAKTDSEINKTQQDEKANETEKAEVLTEAAKTEGEEIVTPVLKEAESKPQIKPSEIKPEQGSIVDEISGIDNKSINWKLEDGKWKFKSVAGEWKNGSNSDQSRLNEKWAKGQGFEVTPEVTPEVKPSTLSKEEQDVENRFRSDLEENYEERKKDYIAKHGLVFDTDRAREFSEDYRQSPELLAGATQNAARDFVGKMYKEELQKPAPEGKSNVVMFTAGGPGAGKSSSLRQLDTNQHITVDTTMSDFEWGVKDINEALDAGKDVVIAYTFRDPFQAFTDQKGGVIHRSKTIGRTVPSDVSVDITKNSLEAIKKLSEHFKDNKRVKFQYFNNDATKGDSKQITLEDVKEIKLDTEKSKKEIKNELDKQYREGGLEGGKYSAENLYAGLTGDKETIRRSIAGLGGRFKQTVGEGTKQPESGSERAAVKEPSQKDTKSGTEPEKKIKKSAKKIADKVRSLKSVKTLNDLNGLKSANPFNIFRDGTLEIVSTAIETGGSVAQMIADAMSYLKKSDWYKGLSQEGKVKAEEAVPGIVKGLQKEYTETKKSEEAEKKKSTEPKKEKEASKPGVKKERAGYDKLVEKHPELKAYKQDPIKFYTSTTNQFQTSQANDILDMYEPEQYFEAIIETENIRPDVRSAMSQIAMQRLSNKSKEARKSGDKESAKKYTDIEVKIANAWQERKTLAAQELQAASIMNTLSPDGFKVLVRQAIDKGNAYKKKKAVKKAAGTKKKIDSSANEAAGDLDKSMNEPKQKKVKEEKEQEPEIIDEYKGKILDISKNKIFKKARFDKAVNQFKDFGKRMNDVTSVAHLVKPMIEIMGAYAEAGVRDFGTLSKLVTKKIGKGFEHIYSTAYKSMRETMIENGSDPTEFSSNSEVSKFEKEQVQKKNRLNQLAEDEGKSKTDKFSDTEGEETDIEDASKKVASRVIKDAFDATGKEGVEKEAELSIQEFINKVIAKSRDSYDSQKGKSKRDVLQWAIDNIDKTREIFNQARNEVYEAINNAENVDPERKNEIVKFLEGYESAIFDSVLTIRNKNGIVNDAIRELGYVKENGQADWNKLMNENAGDVEAVHEKIREAVSKKTGNKDLGKQVADSIIDRYNLLFSDKIKNQIKRDFDRTNKAKQKALLPKEQQKRTSKIDKLIAAHNAGKLTGESIVSEMKEEFGLETLSDAEIEEVETLLNELEDATGVDANEIRERVSFIISSKEPGYGMKVLFDRMYARLLGGPITMLKNATGFMEVFHKMFGEAMKNKDFASFKIAIKRAFGTGIFRDVMRGGLPIGENIYMSDVNRKSALNTVRKLEFEKHKLGSALFGHGKGLRIPFLSWVLDQEKFIPRILNAFDAYNQQMVTDMSYYSFIKKQIKDGNPGISNKEAGRRAFEALNYGEIEKAKIEAERYYKSQGKKVPSSRIRRKAYEIIAEDRNKKLQEKSELEGMDALFKGKPEMLSITGIPSKIIQGTYNYFNEMIDKAEAEGNYPPWALETLRTIVNTLKFAVIPFVTGVGNIVEKGMELIMPYAIAKSGIYKGAEKLAIDQDKKDEYRNKAQRIFARGITGTMGFASIITLAAISQAMDDDDDDTIYDEEKNTLRFFGSDISADYFGTFATGLKIAGGAKVWGKSKNQSEIFDPENPNGRQKGLFASIFESVITEASYYKGVGELYEAFTEDDPDKWTKYLNRRSADLTTLGVIPFRNTIKQGSELVSTDQKFTNGYFDELLKYAGVTRGMLEHSSIDAFGRPVDSGQRYPSSASGFISIFNGGFKKEPFEKELEKFDINIYPRKRTDNAAFIKDQTGEIRMMSHDELYTYNMIRGKVIHKLMEDMTDQKLFDKYDPSDPAKKDMVKKIVSKRISVANNIAKRGIEEIVKESEGYDILNNYTAEELQKRVNLLIPEHFKED